MNMKMEAKAIVATAQTEAEAFDIVNAFCEREDVQLLWFDIRGRKTKIVEDDRVLLSEAGSVRVTLVYERETINQFIDEVKLKLAHVNQAIDLPERLTEDKFKEYEIVLEAVKVAVEIEVNKNKQIWELMGKSMNRVRRERWNELHDFDHEIRYIYRSLGHKYTTRDWTSIDWQQWEFVTANID